jgi:hypothetical protein
LICFEYRKEIINPSLIIPLFRSDSSQVPIMIFVAMMGAGMGLSIPLFLAAVQTGVERRHVGVSVMGAVLSTRLALNLNASAAAILALVAVFFPPRRELKDRASDVEVPMVSAD